MEKQRIVRLQSGTYVIGEVVLVAHRTREVHLQTTSGATFEESITCFFYLPKVVQVIVTTLAVLILRPQHVRLRERQPT